MDEEKDAAYLSCFFFYLNVPSSRPSSSGSTRSVVRFTFRACCCGFYVMVSQTITSEGNSLIECRRFKARPLNNQTKTHWCVLPLSSRVDTPPPRFSVPLCLFLPRIILDLLISGFAFIVKAAASLFCGLRF